MSASLLANTNYVLVHILCILMIQLMTVERVTNKEISARTLPTPHTKCYDRDSPLLCVNSSFNCSQIICSKSVLLLSFGHCATYDEETRLLHIANCPHYPLSDYNVAAPR